MTNKTMTSVVAGLLFACAGLANAGEPVALTDSQLDNVSAGATFAIGAASASAIFGLAASGATTRSVDIGPYHSSSATAVGLAVGVGARSSAFAASGSF